MNKLEFFGGSDLLDPLLGSTQKCLPVEVVTLHQSNAPINSKLWSSPLPSGWKFDAKDITGLLEGLLFLLFKSELAKFVFIVTVVIFVNGCSCCNNISCYLCDFREICELLQGFFINLNFFGPKFRKNLPANAILDISAPICTVSSIFERMRNW